MALIKPSTKLNHRMMNLTKRVPITLFRSTGGKVVNWVWEDGGRDEIPIEANIQPFRPYEIYQMPEAMRAREWVKMYSESEIRGLIDGDDSKLPDEFEWQGNWYIVDKVSPYKMGVLDHYKATAYKKRTTAK